MYALLFPGTSRCRLFAVTRELRRRRHVRWSSDESRDTSSPLRILFCGADEFSIVSLHALHRLRERRPDRVAGIEVVCRPDKRVGRGLKQIQEVPIKPVALSLGLAIHQLDTFTGWTPPSAVDLVVAVSFGLLVPARILRSARLGGVNVHPSLLPDLRGAAPIHHALLRARKFTGVTLQTMHPLRFDHGAVLAQTDPVPVPEDCTPEQLLRALTPLGADLLEKCVETGDFSPLPAHTLPSGSLSPAPKITPEDRHIDWSSWSASTLLRRDLVLGRLWDTSTFSACCLSAGESKRLVFHGPWRLVPEEEMAAYYPGSSVSLREGSEELALRTAEGKLVIPRAATLEGGQREKAIPGLVRGLRRKLSNADAR